MAEMTMEDLLAGLANRDDALAGAITAYAMRPQKSSVITNTTSTNTPYALADMIANRNRVGQATRDLDEALKLRETTGYSLFNALASVPQQQGYGSWLSDFARALGGGAASPMNAYLARAGTKHENAMKDLETILKYDKEMGGTQTQNQVQTMGYQEMPWGGVGGKGKTNAAENIGDKIAKNEITASNLADLYKTIEDNPNTFSSVGNIRQDEASRALRQGVETAGITDMQHREFEYLGNLMPNGFATALNSAKEQEVMAPYTTAYRTGTGSSKKAQIKNMLGAVYDYYKLEAANQGFDMPVTKEQYINSRIGAGRAYNPDFYIKSDAPMYKDGTKTPQQQAKEAADITQRNWNKLYEGLK